MECENLKNEFELLQLIYHRNFNQHRASIWWKHFDILRRFIRKILMCENTFQKQELINIIHKRKLLEIAYRQFNGIIALGQFVTLGLTLVAIVSKIWSILESYRQSSQCITNEKVTNTFEDDIGEEIDINRHDIKLKETNVESGDRNNAKDSSNYITLDKSKSTITMTDIFGDGKQKKKKISKKTDDSIKKVKKKKKKNAMDDIFS